MTVHQSTVNALKSLTPPDAAYRCAHSIEVLLPSVGAQVAAEDFHKVDFPLPLRRSGRNGCRRQIWTEIKLNSGLPPNRMVTLLETNTGLS